MSQKPAFTHMYQIDLPLDAPSRQIALELLRPLLLKYEAHVTQENEWSVWVWVESQKHEALFNEVGSTLIPRPFSFKLLRVSEAAKVEDVIFGRVAGPRS